MRVATLNLWVLRGEWDARRAALRAGLASCAPTIGFQEVIRDAARDTAADLDPSYEVRHRRPDFGDGTAPPSQRWPIAGWHEVDLQPASGPPTSRDDADRGTRRPNPSAPAAPRQPPPCSATASAAAMSPRSITAIGTPANERAHDVAGADGSTH